MNIPQVIQERCPLWTSRLKNEDFDELNEPNEIDGHVLDIARYDVCIAAEAHLFKSCYYVSDPERNGYVEGCFCDECRGFADELDMDIKSESVYKLERDLESFANHLVKHEEVKA